jgi:quercetin dioxygenase-like cupin family protein
MTGRRAALAVALAFAAGIGTGILAGPALSQGRPRMWADRRLELTTAEIPRRVALRVNDDHWDPGAEGGWHRHPGPTIISVLEGELSEQTRSGTSTIRAGQAVWRPARHEHNVRNPGAQPARALAIHLDPAQ